MKTFVLNFDYGATGFWVLNEAGYFESLSLLDMPEEFIANHEDVLEWADWVNLGDVIESGKEDEWQLEHWLKQSIYLCQRWLYCLNKMGLASVEVMFDLEGVRTPVLVPRPKPWLYAKAADFLAVKHNEEMLKQIEMCEAEKKTLLEVLKAQLA